MCVKEIYNLISQDYVTREKIINHYKTVKYDYSYALEFTFDIKQLLHDKIISLT